MKSSPTGVSNLEEIKEFQGPWRGLSNFEGPEIQYGHIWYKKPENAYQAAKFLDLGLRKEFVDLDPGEAKRLARKNKDLIRPDWRVINWTVMNIVNRQKYLDRIYLDLLLRTGTAYLTEGNTWHDNYWGACSCAKCAKEKKYNRLGTLLMDIRDQMEGWLVIFNQKWAIDTVKEGVGAYKTGSAAQL